MSKIWANNDQREGLQMERVERAGKKGDSFCFSAESPRPLNFLSRIHVSLYNYLVRVCPPHLGELTKLRSNLLAASQ